MSPFVATDRVRIRSGSGPPYERAHVALPSLARSDMTNASSPPIGVSLDPPSASGATNVPPAITSPFGAKATTSARSPPEGDATGTAHVTANDGAHVSLATNPLEVPLRVRTLPPPKSIE